MVEVPKIINREYDFHNINTPLMIENLRERVSDLDGGITREEFGSLVTELQECNPNDMVTLSGEIHGEYHSQDFPKQEVLANHLLTLTQSAFGNLLLNQEDQAYRAFRHNQPHKNFMAIFLSDLGNKGGKAFISGSKPLYGPKTIGKMLMQITNSHRESEYGLPDDEYNDAYYNLKWELNTLSRLLVEVVASKDYPEDNRAYTTEIVWSLVNKYFNGYKLEINNQAPKGKANYSLTKRRID